MKKLQIRRITQINGNQFDVFEVLYRDRFGKYRHRHEEYETLEEALKRHPKITIEDLRKQNK